MLIYFWWNELSRIILPFTECCKYKLTVLITVWSVGPRLVQAPIQFHFLKICFEIMMTSGKWNHCILLIQIHPLLKVWKLYNTKNWNQSVWKNDVLCLQRKSLFYLGPLSSVVNDRKYFVIWKSFKSICLTNRSNNCLQLITIISLVTA